MDMEGDLFCLLWAHDYSTHTVEQSRVFLSHYYGIASSVLPSQETYSEDTRAMLPHYLNYFITDVEQFFYKTITFKSMSFSVYTVVWPNKTVLQSKFRGPLLCRFSFVLWAGHRGILLPPPSFLLDRLAHLVSQNTRATSLPRQSGALRLRLWASQFLFLSELERYIVVFWFNRTQT